MPRDPGTPQGGADPRDARVLVVDHHDSYTGNLVQLLWCLTGRAPLVVLHDDPRAGELDLGAVTHLVLGPGPGTPHDPGDLGCAVELLRRTTAPALGVCLGFQAMAVALGGRVVPAPAPAHGLVDTITSSGGDLLAGLPERFEAVRYHSLRVEDPAPEALTITARGADGVAMAGECAELGLYGVQFHPESIGTPLGEHLLETFLTHGRRGGPAGRRALLTGSPDPRAAASAGSGGRRR